MAQNNASSALEEKMQDLVSVYGLQACQEALLLQNHLPSSTTASVVDHPQADDETVERVASSNKSKSSSTSRTTTTTTTKHEHQRIKEAMLDSSFDSMFAVDETGIIQTVNRAAVQAFGYLESEMIGQNISLIVGGGHAKHHDQYMETFRLTRETHLIGTLRELPARRKDGSEFPCILGIQVIELDDDDDVDDKDDNDEHKNKNKILFFASIRDITAQVQARKLAEENARERKTKEAILHVAFDSLFMTDCKGTILFVNKTALKTFGYDHEDELIGQNVAETIVGGDHGTKHDMYMDRYMKTRQKHIIGTQREVPARRKDGTEFPAILGIELVEQEHGDDEEPFYVAFVRDITHEKREMELEVEKRAAEELLLNMLPPEIASRLKLNPSHLADHHDSATMLFADIVGFTSLSSKISPVEVVRLLNDLFSRFDELVDAYQLNKVKTIGDCYMVTSVPGRSDDDYSCASICHFALDMLEALKHYNTENQERPLSIRVGINTGPVVAGIVGTKRFLYDLWGDSVNLASRMESTGEPGKIQVTREVVEVVPEGEFEFESRGEIFVKGKGTMETYFLTDRLRDHYNNIQDDDGGD